jgi:hypothetical protein
VLAVVLMVCLSLTEGVEFPLFLLLLQLIGFDTARNGRWYYASVLLRTSIASGY